MKKYFLFLILALIFISSCATIRPSETGISKLTGSPNGIQIKFLPEQPSDEIFEGSDVNLGLELTNNAACDARGKLYITDTAPSSRGGITEFISRDFDLPGATVEGSKQRIEKTNFFIKASPYTGLDRPEGLQVTLEATAIYNCRFTSGPQFCVKSTFGEEQDCKITETITGNQLRAYAAPVAITKVVKKTNPESGGVRLVTEITLSKMSNGYVSNEASTQNPLTISEEDPININVDFDGNQMECSGSNFRDNKLFWKANDPASKTITCHTLVNVVERIDGNLNINLDYVYKVTESKSIKITKLTQTV
mgnify:CR=1 FL=1